MERLELVIEAEASLVEEILQLVVDGVRDGTVKVYVVKRREVEA